METLKERLKRLAKELCSSVRAFEKSIGVSNGYIGCIRVSIQPDVLARIKAKYPEVSVEWIMLGTGEIYSAKHVGEEQRDNLPQRVHQVQTDVYRDKYIALLEENKALQAKIISQLTDISSMQAKIDTLNKGLEQMVGTHSGESSIDVGSNEEMPKARVRIKKAVSSCM